MTSEFTRDTEILGVKAGKIAGVIEAEGGVFVNRCPQALLAIGQTMLDMTESGRYGTGLNRVLFYHFTSPEKHYHPECLETVRQVFLLGKKRDPDWHIYQFRSFYKYADKNGEPDEKKTASLRKELTYLGKDGFSDRWGHFYFGEKRSFQVQVGAYFDKKYALKKQEFLKERQIDSKIFLCRWVDGRKLYKVRTGSFSNRKDAENYIPLLRAKGITDAFTVWDF